jgi:diaminopimelate epimerase
LKFFKYHACGNDYVYIDCFKNTIDDPESLSVRISHRHFGIGADGLIIVCHSGIADAKMRIFNSDGSEGKMCGNGIRCAAKYLYDERCIGKQDIEIETLSGIKHVKILESDGNFSKVRVDMGLPEFEPDKIPANFDGTGIIGLPVKILENDYELTCVFMGNPHCVIFCDDLENLDIKVLGPAVQNCGKFPEGVNVEFVKIIQDGIIKMRVWERGSDETFACGTGACAAAIASVLNGFVSRKKQIKVISKGGKMLIDYQIETVFMTGEAIKVFEGEF